MKRDASLYVLRHGEVKFPSIHFKLQLLQSPGKGEAPMVSTSSTTMMLIL